MSVDGTDFRIQQQTPWSTAWFSYKHRGPGLRYEVCVCILSGDIVWWHGPFPCGRFHDIQIFRRGLLGEMDDARIRTGRIEMVEADKGYRGERLYCVVPDDNADAAQRRMKYRVAQRHETVNKRLKQWGCLKRVFRHNILKHQSVFGAVAVITQLSLQNGEPLFSVEYNDA
jgi:hypothetical protein